ncbi:MAG: sugar phosphate isomerase/epimerase [Spirochaetota bacterium]
MKGSIRENAKIGLVHHMLYPACTGDEAFHVETLASFVKRTDIDTFDCCVPYGADARKKATAIVTSAGKPVCYATHLIPLRKLSCASLLPNEQGIMRMLMIDQLDAAKAVGAKEMIFASGADAAAGKRAEALAMFKDFCVFLCTEAKKRGITVLLEPFDTDFDKKFLMGPTTECVNLIHSLEPKIDNLGIELDMAHIPLMHETFDQAIRTVAPYLKRVHLGNCVMKDASNPWYGDNHPPMGIEGGEIDVPVLTEILRILVDIGYIGKDNKGTLVVEMQPFPGRSVDETIADNFRRLDEAWESV